MSNKKRNKRTAPARSARQSSNNRADAGRSGGAAKATRSRRTMMLGLVAAAVVVVGAVLVLSNRSASSTIANSGAPGSTSVASASAGSGSAGAIPADEQKYIGRLLPAGYQEPQTQPASYSSAIQMTDIAADTSGSQVSVAMADVTTNKIVSFAYTTASGESIPLLAYVKPSGALFVGVSYCIPCKGTRQYIDADGTLTCNSCGTKRDLTTGVGLSGACRLYPLDELPARVSGDRLVVDKAVLDQWAPQPQDRQVG